MGTINMGRVILGGLIAGGLMNISEYVLHGIVLEERTREALKALGQTPPYNLRLLAMLVGITFVLGILAVWLYAAIRPRFGPGPKTAVCAGLAVWAMAFLYSAVYLHAGYSVFPRRVIGLPVLWGLFEVPLATLVGAWFYKE